MTKKCTSANVSAKSADAEINAAIRRIYQTYGGDLSAFARDVEMQSAHERHESTDKSRGWPRPPKRR